MNWRILSKMLLEGTTEEKDNATKKIDEWMLEDMKKNIPQFKNQDKDAKENELAK